MLAEEALAAVGEAGLPPATVQMIYKLAPEDGLRLVAEARLGATGFTGSRAAGLSSKPPRTPPASRFISKCPV